MNRSLIADSAVGVLPGFRTSCYESPWSAFGLGVAEAIVGQQGNKQLAANSAGVR